VSAAIVAAWLVVVVPGFRGVDGEEHAFGAGVVAEVSGDHLCVADFGAWLREVDAEGCPYVVVGEGDADQAFLGPEPQGVADETEDVGGGFDGERFHVLSPSAAGRHRVCQSDVCVVLIEESPLGLRVRGATWGTGSGLKLREEIGDRGAPS
jgi:hypothetical protein